MLSVESLLSTWIPGHGQETQPGQGGLGTPIELQEKVQREGELSLRSAGLFTLA